MVSEDTGELPSTRLKVSYPTLPISIAKCDDTSFAVHARSCRAELKRCLSFAGQTGKNSREIRGIHEVLDVRFW